MSPDLVKYIKQQSIFLRGMSLAAFASAFAPPSQNHDGRHRRDGGRSFELRVGSFNMTDFWTCS
jgi:hypothetical protein